MKLLLLNACLLILIEDGEAWGWWSSKVTMTICQNQKLTLHCSGGKVIKVHYANYGRTSYHICPRGTLLTDDCEGHNTKKIVKRKCNGRRRCRLRATNAIYGNPCRGTTKYLEVKFSCVEPRDDDRKRFLKEAEN
ncbi:D-galactoside-specific lectin-like [Crassostrea virginica]